VRRAVKPRAAAATAPRPAASASTSVEVIRGVQKANSEF